MANGVKRRIFMHRSYPNMSLWIINFSPPNKHFRTYNSCINLVTGTVFGPSVTRHFIEIFPTQEEIDVFIMLYPESKERWQAKSSEELARFSRERR